MNAHMRNPGSYLLCGVEFKGQTTRLTETTRRKKRVTEAVIRFGKQFRPDQDPSEVV